MKYKQLGNTGLLVSQLALGTMTFSSGKGIYKILGSIGQEDADQMVRKCVDVGINFFDTADVYGSGESEITLGQSFHNLGIARKML
jgi:aryl-alcohol dehydrogenase-like predicted oxidoreductase